MTEHKFTDEEIIKALECCYSNDSNDCYKCPYIAESTAEMFCDKKLTRDALDLIKRQKAEIAFWQDAAANAKKEILLEIESLALSKIPEDVEVTTMKDTYYIEAIDELMIKYGVTDKNVGCKIEEEKE